MKQKQIFQLDNSRGYTVLFAVIVVGAVSLVIMTSLSFVSFGSVQSAGINYKSNQANALANACAESALQEVRSSDTYTGSNNITLGSGTCSFTVTNSGGDIREIRATGSVGDVIRKVKVQTSALNPLIIISSWQEVADF